MYNYDDRKSKGSPRWKEAESTALQCGCMCLCVWGLIAMPRCVKVLYRQHAPFPFRSLYIKGWLCWDAYQNDVGITGDEVVIRKVCRQNLKPIILQKLNPEPQTLNPKP